jgi:Fe-S-cluster containining protein
MLPTDLTMSKPMEDSAPSINVSFSLRIAGGFLHTKAVVPGGHTTLTQLLPIIQGLENNIVAKIDQEAVAAGSPISCKAGCGACCRQLVPVSLFEAEALTEWIATLPADERAKLESRFHQALLALRDAGVLDKILDDRWVHDQGATSQLAIDYFHAGVPCPFLENESCSIHSIRPLSCREYLVTSPPAYCQDPSVDKVAGVQLPLKLSRALYALGRQLEQDPRGWIPLVFLITWGRSGARPGDHYSGTGVEVLRKFLDQVAANSSPPDEKSPDEPLE